MKNYFETTPDGKGFFGPYGGSFIPEALQIEMDKITEAYKKVSTSDEFIGELQKIRTHYQGRPTPVYHCATLSRRYGGEVYLKREDLNHTGAHKLNHCMGEALLARYMGKRRLIAETGAGQHGVALATAAAYFGLECEIHMGEVDMVKEHPNVVRMKVLGARVVPVGSGAKTLKEAVDSAFESYSRDPVQSMYCIGSVVGPHPFPLMVRDFQKVVGLEAKEQFFAMTHTRPDAVVACVGGGSNAMGLFSAFLDEEATRIIGVEPAGRSLQKGEHAATISYGRPGIIHGFRCYLLQDESGNPDPVYSIASGLDYPGVGPEHCMLNDSGRVEYQTATDREALDAFFELSRSEGIIPALESAHAVAAALRLLREKPNTSLLVNLSGRGDKDVDFVVRSYGGEYGIEQ